ncbi:MAG: hypothetical protein AAB588_00125 [Patescibacteria group bacterium]
MRLILTDSIKKSELSPLEKVFPLKVIQIAARKALLGLGESIKNPMKVPFTCLKKLYLTGTSGAGRVIFLLLTNEQQSVLVMLRHKNDKKIGANMAIQNPRFKGLLERNLNLIAKDLQNGKFEASEI